jgi:hypothetical protein
MSAQSVPKLTFEGGLLREQNLLPAVRTLKALEAEGKIEIFETDRAKETKAASNAAYNWPGAAPRSTKSRAPRRPAAGAVSFQNLSAVLFPQRDAHRLNITEVNNVAHLLNHHTSGRTIFVTKNAEVFLADGKRERLATLKIIVLTPEETVVALEQSAAEA